MKYFKQLSIKERGNFDEEFFNSKNVKEENLYRKVEIWDKTRMVVSSNLNSFSPIQILHFSVIYAEIQQDSQAVFSICHFDIIILIMCVDSFS